MSTLRHLRSLLYRLGCQGQWRWQPTDDEDRQTREPVHDGSKKSPRVFGVGETLSAVLHPYVLAELCVSDENCQLALERLQGVAWTLRRVQRRAYNARQSEHYQALRQATTELTVAMKLLESHSLLSMQDLEAWEKKLSQSIISG